MKCQLVIQDEVNVKFNGLDPVTRKRMVTALKFINPKARHTPAYRLGRWDGTVSYCTIGGGTYLNLLDKVLPIVIDAGYEIETIDDRFHKKSFPLEPVDENVVSHICWPKGHRFENKPIVLEEHQVRTINACFENPQSLQSVSTGAGKCCAYETIISLDEIQNPSFSLFLQNVNNIQLGWLIDTIANYKNIKLVYDREVGISDLCLYIPTPSGPAKITHIIKKKADGLKITFENNHVLKCAKKHILQRNGIDIFADQLYPGLHIDTKHGKMYISNIEDDGCNDYYDISVPEPHLYYDASGVLHHNTITTAVLALKCEKYGRTITIVPNIDLVNQTEADFKLLGLDVGVLYGERKDFDKTHTICTWQSLNSLDKQAKTHARGQVEISQENLITLLTGQVAIVVDECHQAKGQALKNLLSGPFSDIPIRWGLSGTIPKDDYEFFALLSMIGPNVGQVTAKELQDKGFLAGCHIDILQLIEDVNFGAYEWQDELRFLTSDERRLRFIANIIREKAESGNTLILVDRLEAGKQLQEYLGDDCVFISGNTKTKVRKEQYAEINVSDKKIVIATYGVAAVGLNIPRIFNLFLIEAGKSFVRTIQSIGRGLRKAADKDDVKIYDVCATTRSSDKHMKERRRLYKQAQYAYTHTKIDYLRISR